MIAYDYMYVYVYAPHRYAGRCLCLLLTCRAATRHQMEALLTNLPVAAWGPGSSRDTHLAHFGTLEGRVAHALRREPSFAWPTAHTRAWREDLPQEMQVGMGGVAGAA